MEAKGAKLVNTKFSQMGYRTKVDQIGIILAGKDLSSKNSVIVSAHLDTVFPEEIEIKIRSKETRLLDPRVGDDS
ncbi:MAG: peptidase M20, partial [Candidatus Heimdallarchaeota archaeon]|nr:peptidase M20 [Candidatus Heimdallarchaeota archaeon]